MLFACVGNFAQRCAFLCCVDGQFQQVAFAGFGTFGNGGQCCFYFLFVAVGTQGLSNVRSVTNERLYCRFPECRSDLLFPNGICSHQQWFACLSRCGLVCGQQLLRYAFLERRFRSLWPYHPVFQLLRSTPKLWCTILESVFQRSTNLPMGQPRGRFQFPAEYRFVCYVQYVPRNRLAKRMASSSALVCSDWV
jgi:hypothetical protein